MQKEMRRAVIMRSRRVYLRYRAVAAKVIVKTPPPVPAVESASAAAPKSAPVPAKKPTKAALKGVIVKKKSKPAPAAKAPPDSAKVKEAAHDDPSPDPKRRKVAVES
jgi:hypothetical protein